MSTSRRRDVSLPKGHAGCYAQHSRSETPSSAALLTRGLTGEKPVVEQGVRLPAIPGEGQTFPPLDGTRDGVWPRATGVAIPPRRCQARARRGEGSGSAGLLPADGALACTCRTAARWRVASSTWRRPGGPAPPAARRYRGPATRQKAKCSHTRRQPLRPPEDGVEAAQPDGLRSPQRPRTAAAAAGGVGGGGGRPHPAATAATRRGAEAAPAAGNHPPWHLSTAGSRARSPHAAGGAGAGACPPGRGRWGNAGWAGEAAGAGAGAGCVGGLGGGGGGQRRRQKHPPGETTRAGFTGYLRRKEFVFPLSLRTELLLPAVLTLFFFFPHLSSELKSIIFSFNDCDLLCCDLHQGMQNNCRAHFPLLVWKYKRFLPACLGFLGHVELNRFYLKALARN